MKNYDLNMKYMNNLSSDDFNHALNVFLSKNKGITQITDLTTCDCMEGIYILVLDAYKQVYIGQSTNIKKRIMGHWSKTKPFDRLIFGRVENSILSIDSFGALDTTRIFVCPTSHLFEVEAKLVRSMDAKYMLNRTAGGIGLDEDTYKLEVLASAAHRDM